MGRIARRDRAIPVGISGENFEVLSLGRAGKIGKLRGRADLIGNRLASPFHGGRGGKAHSACRKRAHLLKGLDFGGGEGQGTGGAILSSAGVSLRQDLTRVFGYTRARVE